MANKLKHWTERSVSAFVHRLSFDFITQIQKKMGKAHITRRIFANRLNLTLGRISQLLNYPGNIELESAVQYARAAGLKVALVAYDDNDPENNNGPINSEIFTRCWNLQGAPKDFFELSIVSTAQMKLEFYPEVRTSVNKEFSYAHWHYIEKLENVADTAKDYIGSVQ